MEVSVKNKGKLGRCLEIEVPAEEFDKSFNQELRKTSRKIKLPGFRSGKVPPKVVQDMFGDQILKEVAATMMESAYNEAVVQNDMIPAGQPEFKDVGFALKEGIQFKANLEVLPEFDPVLLSGVRLDIPTTEVTSETVDHTLNKMRLDRAEWKEAVRDSNNGDRVTIQFNDKKAKDYFPVDENNQLTEYIGDATVVETFSKQFLKVGKGAILKIAPQQPKPKGKEFIKQLFSVSQRFSATVIRVEEPLLPEIDEKFLQQYGVNEGGLEKLKELLREGLALQIKDKIKQVKEKKIADALIEKNPIDVPQVLVKREIDFLRRDMASRMNVKLDEAENIEAKFGDELFLEQAEHNVRLNLITHKIADKHGVKIDNKMFEEKLNELVNSYESPEDMKKYLRRDQQARAWVRTMVLREKIFTMVTKSAQLTDQTLPFSDLMKS